MSEGKRVQVEESEYKWWQVSTNEGKGVQMKESE